MIDKTEYLNSKASALVELCKEKGVSVGFAESLTGGMISSSVVNIPGASAVFKGSVVSYTNEIKERVLGVSEDIITANTEVSAECAEAMAIGAARTLGVELVISVTGIAGPTGELPGKPVGTVYMGYYYECPDFFGELTGSVRLNLTGDRDAIRTGTVLAALDLASKLVKEGKA
ncbi:MAG: CinA family protein [Clostridiales bacterium]|nr:CinA family protein [Clostridiales bacterium]